MLQQCLESHRYRCAKHTTLWCAYQTIFGVISTLFFFFYPDCDLNPRPLLHFLTSLGHTALLMLQKVCLHSTLAFWCASTHTIGVLMIWCAMHTQFFTVHGAPVKSLSLLSYIAIVCSTKALITPSLERYYFPVVVVAMSYIVYT